MKVAGMYLNIIETLYLLWANLQFFLAYTSIVFGGFELKPMTTLLPFSTGSTRNGGYATV